jgi:hypothetical protein
VPEVFLHAAL